MPELQEKDSRQKPITSEITKGSPPQMQMKVNSFLNGLGKGESYDWTDKKFAFMLNDPNYHVAFMEKDGQVIAAQDYLINNGTLNLLRVRTSPEDSRIHAQESGQTLGDEIFDSVLNKNSSAKKIYSEVNPSGMKYLKRQAHRKQFTVVKEVAPDTSGFGVIEINLDHDQQAAEKRLQKLQQIKASLS